MISMQLLSQAPHLFNYQGVARDGTGNIIVSGSIGLKFEIVQGSPTGTVAYAETTTANPSSSGIFTTAIGAGTPVSGPLSSVNWANGPFFIRVSIDPAGGTSYSSVGTSQLLSVPYALYAEKAGNGTSLPTGTLTGQTLFWDNGSNQWKIDNNFFNNGNNVNIGDPTIGNNKVKITDYSTTDSSALFVYKPFSQANQAAVRGIASGSASNSGSLTINPIVGGHFLGYNVNPTGSAVGMVGQGVSPSGDAVGVIAIASSSSSVIGRSVGLYASSTGPYYANSMAAIFDRGKVYINDTIITGLSGANGDVLTRGINGKTFWSSPGGPWKRANLSMYDNVFLATNSDLVSIGLPIGVGANEKLHVHSILGDAYINLSTTGTSNNVGLVFGQSTNWSKAFLTFDNNSSSLTYRLFSKRIMLIEGANGATHFGNIPIGAASGSMFSIYDSVISASPRPILKLINTTGILSGPTSLYFGDGSAPNGMTLNFIRSGSTDYLRISDGTTAGHYHTFTNNGAYYPGSDGGSAKANIAGGNLNTSDIVVNASAAGNIILNGYTKIGDIANIVPAIKTFTVSHGGIPNAGGNAQITLPVSAAKVLSVDIFIDNTSGSRIPPGNTMFAGNEYYYDLNGTTLFIYAPLANSSNIINKPIKVFVTYEK